MAARVIARAWNRRRVARRALELLGVSLVREDMMRDDAFALCDAIFEDEPIFQARFVAFDKFATRHGFIRLDAIRRRMEPVYD